MPEVRATIGFVAGVTPVIDKYSHMASLLGEHFLMVRSSPDRQRLAQRASENTGREGLMTQELRNTFTTFIESLDFTRTPEFTAEQEEVRAPGGARREATLALGPIVLSVGHFIGSLIEFLVIALVVFVIMKQLEKTPIK